MIELDKKYLDTLKSIIDEIQSSDILANYLEEEDDDLYTELKDAFEPKIEELHGEVALNDPLQLVSFERELLDAGLEGLFLPGLILLQKSRSHYRSGRILEPNDLFLDEAADLVVASAPQRLRIHRRLASQQLIEENSEGIDIAAGVDIEATRAGLFRTHVGWRADELLESRVDRLVSEQLATGGFGDAKIN